MINLLGKVSYINNLHRPFRDQKGKKFLILGDMVENAFFRWKITFLYVEPQKQIGHNEVSKNSVTAGIFLRGSGAGGVQRP